MRSMTVGSCRAHQGSTLMVSVFSCICSWSVLCFHASPFSFICIAVHMEEHLFVGFDVQGLTGMYSFAYRDYVRKLVENVCIFLSI